MKYDRLKRIIVIRDKATILRLHITGLAEVGIKYQGVDSKYETRQ